jgi:hypothetical protein
MSSSVSLHPGTGDYFGKLAGARHHAVPIVMVRSMAAAVIVPPVKLCRMSYRIPCGQGYRHC